MLYNYVSNAIKCTGENGRIVIRSRFQPPDCFRIEVKDNGIGIRAEDTEKLFTAFRQIENSQHKNNPGTGLGLALTKQIVEARGGRVGVRSVPGEGSTIFAVLPRVGGDINKCFVKRIWLRGVRQESPRSQPSR